MSTIFSDPGWRRGSTLLNREAIELDADSRPIAGRELIGQVKVFQDVDPSSGQRYSNRLVYCVAARYTGSTTLTSADAGKVVSFNTVAASGPLISPSVYDLTDGPLSEFGGVATTTDVNTNFRTYGVLDEYLTEDVRQNDIVWVVMKGPTSVQSAGTAVAAGGVVEVTGTAGRIQTRSSGSIIGTQLNGASVGGTAGALIRVNLHNDRI
jgi:hypothetical protein